MKLLGDISSSDEILGQRCQGMPSLPSPLGQRVYEGDEVSVRAHGGERVLRLLHALIHRPNAGGRILIFCHSVQRKRGGQAWVWQAFLALANCWAGMP